MLPPPHVFPDVLDQVKAMPKQYLCFTQAMFQLLKASMVAFHTGNCHSGMSRINNWVWRHMQPRQLALLMVFCMSVTTVILQDQHLIDHADMTMLDGTRQP